MRRIGQALTRELAALMIHNRPGEVVYETALFEYAVDRVLCVAAPQSKAEAVFQAVADTPEAALILAINGDLIVHDAFNVPDDVIVWLSDLPGRPGIEKPLAELKQAQQFLTREKVWEEDLPPAAATGPDPGAVADGSDADA